jgi:predicted ABC-type exoprotein transport system permease subunit
MSPAIEKISRHRRVLEIMVCEKDQLQENCQFNLHFRAFLRYSHHIRFSIEAVIVAEFLQFDTNVVVRK